MATLRDHVIPILAEYRAQISRGRFEEVEQALLDRQWLGRDGAMPPLEPDQLRRLNQLFGTLQGAVARRNRQGAFRTISRIRSWVHRIPVG